MNELTRNPAIIAAEINSIKEQTRSVLLSASIEIGKRLKEAKAMVKHGEWAQWLADNVDYSQRTATDLMAIADGYQNANWQTFADLTQSQAVALLGLPLPEREEYVESHDMEHTSVRELTEQVRELREQLEGKQASIAEIMEHASVWENAAGKAEARALELERDRRALQDQIKARQEAVDNLRAEADRLNSEIAAAKESAGAAEMDKLKSKLAMLEKKKVTLESEKAKLAEELKAALEKPADIVQVMPPEAEEELTELRRKVQQLPNEQVAEFRVRFAVCNDDFREIIDCVSGMEGADRDRYILAVKRLLAKYTDVIDQIQ